MENLAKNRAEDVIKNKKLELEPNEALVEYKNDFNKITQKMDSLKGSVKVIKKEIKALSNQRKENIFDQRDATRKIHKENVDLSKEEKDIVYSESDISLNEIKNTIQEKSNEKELLLNEINQAKDELTTLRLKIGEVFPKSTEYRNMLDTRDASCIFEYGDKKITLDSGLVGEQDGGYATQEENLYTLGDNLYKVRCTYGNYDYTPVYWTPFFTHESC